MCAQYHGKSDFLHFQKLIQTIKRVKQQTFDGNNKALGENINPVDSLRWLQKENIMDRMLNCHTFSSRPTGLEQSLFLCLLM